MNRRSFAYTVDSPDLTVGQRQHLEQVIRDFVYHTTDKYIKGQIEHGGNLYEKSIDFLLDQMEMEAIDQFVYVRTLRARLQNLVRAEVVERDDNNR